MPCLLEMNKSQPLD